MRVLKLGILAAACLWLSACAHGPTPPATAASSDRLTVMISLDAFRPDYLNRGLTPNLNAIAAQGVRAVSVKPSFPSQTFPNHYTLVTGLRPDHHGIVSNIMDDPVLGHFDKPSDDPRWFEGGTPLWITAEKAGIRSASVFWPGSVVALQGAHLSYWSSYKPLPAGQRIDMALAWLDLPPAQRPRFVTIYIDEVDGAGHNFGPYSPQVNTAVATVDAAVGRLIDGLKARGMWDRTDLVVASDHGMAVLDPKRIDVAEDLIDPAIAKATNPGPFTGFTPAPGRAGEAEAILLAPHPNLDCWRRSEMPARFGYGANPRVTPIVCLSKLGSEVRMRGQKAGGGDHGYDPAEPDMQAFMVARGPAFRTGVVLAPIDNVDLYPMMAKILGIAPAANDGDPAHTAPALK